MKAGGQARRNSVAKHKSRVGVLCWFRTFEQLRQEHFYTYTWPALATYYKLSLDGRHAFIQQRCNIKWTGPLLYWMLRVLPVHCKLTQVNWHTWFFYFFFNFQGQAALKLSTRFLHSNLPQNKHSCVSGIVSETYSETYSETLAVLIKQGMLVVLTSKHLKLSQCA